MNLNLLFLIGVGIKLPNSIMKSPTPDQMEKNHCKSMMSTAMNHNENFRNNNVLPSYENKVINNNVSYYYRIRVNV